MQPSGRPGAGRRGAVVESGRPSRRLADEWIAGDGAATDEVARGGAAGAVGGGDDEEVHVAGRRGA